MASPENDFARRLEILKELRQQMRNSSSNITSFDNTNFNFTMLPASFNVSSVLNRLDDLFKTIVSVFNCIDDEYFEGFSDEEALVKRAINTSAAPTIASKCMPALQVVHCKFPELC